MLRIYKLYLKWKLSSLIKNKLMQYSKEKTDFSQKQLYWKCEVYDGKCMSKEHFERRQEEQIQFFTDKWKESHHKGEAVLEVLRIIEQL